MEIMDTLTKRILSRLKQHHQQVAEAQQLLDVEMRTILDNQELFCIAANRILSSIIQPRMEELTQHFENTTLVPQSSSQDFSCYCSFTHTSRFPATVSFKLTLTPGESHDELTVHYDVNILPIFMDYRRNDTLQASFDGSDETIAQWVDDRILEFIDTYLKLEIHPLYQKDNLVLDPVCGMHIPVNSAPCKVEKDGQTSYFCSEHCKNAFLK